ncbi:tetratricopeptide repeat protein [Flavimaricola marinus]|uniref:Uncharacterized protein n=1 Tax=Flavimaricola marinus TaxID=1819565 RepID=A0A238LIJ0_9RHOB|nr:hypothetical protein [Flavimaricola marinus]SMY09215.1 hypothetical protein LOM8899_03380 [Flavimaricola marinus]
MSKSSKKKRQRARRKAEKLQRKHAASYERGTLLPPRFLDVADAEIVEVEPDPAQAVADPALLERSRAHWELGDWEQLAALADQPLEHHPDRAKLSLLAGVGLAQHGDMTVARRHVRQALEWGCPRDLVARVMAAGVHNSLGRAASLHQDEARALGHFETSIATVSPRVDAKALGRARNIHEKARLGQLPEAANLLEDGMLKMRDGVPPDSAQLQAMASSIKALQIELAAVRAKAGQQGSAGARRRHSPQPRGLVAPPFVAVIAGVPRSGSTWSYNAARLLCERNNLSYYAEWCEDYKPEDHPACDLHIVKLHAPEQLIETRHRIVTSYRDLAERLASLVRVGWLADEPEAIRKAARHQATLTEYWADKSDFEISYDDILHRPHIAVLGIAETLDIPCTEDMARGIADGLVTLKADAAEVNDRGHASDTLMHSDHRATDDQRRNYLAKVQAALAGGIGEGA